VELIRSSLSASEGFFCRTAEERLFYFSKLDRRLFDLDQRLFQFLLTNLSGLSSTETLFKFAIDILRADAAQTKPVQIHTIADFDQRTGFLAVSDGGPGVWARERGGRW